ncbi:MAG: prepilin-type N-terminal cleavage/methylation domain-containing protein [Gemmatimonadales bacterium]|jgi:prepilin-type N-terminal cleavage/methylation domain-containing protein|nr:prepilin-type N-terminal cleavage/methylation domain-containing protein [Gemmatimonadales bacterium]
MRNRGVSLLELLVVLAVVATLLALAAPSFARVRDAMATDRAARELALFYAQARYGAILRATRVRIEFGADSLRAVYESVQDSVFILRPGPARHGVSLAASRSVIRIYPNGFALGAANTKLIVRRGAAAESLTTSRLGRMRRW